MGYNVSSLQRSRADNLTKKLAQQFADDASGGFVKDERYYELKGDAAGIGQAIIRFLPSPIDDEPNFVKLFTHGLKNGDRWYIENSRTTLSREEADPCAEEFWRVRKPETEAAKLAAAKFGRKLHYISNIMVIDDPEKPENNGKVFLFKFPKTVFDMIKEAYTPEFGGESMDPFHLFEGANFLYRFYKKDGFRKYDKSKFDAPSPLAKNEKELGKLLEGKGWSLNAEIAPEKFKSYDELKAKFDAVMGRTAGSEVKVAAKPKAVKVEEKDEDLPWDEPKATPKVVAKASSKKTDFDEELDAFSSMADDD